MYKHIFSILILLFGITVPNIVSAEVINSPFFTDVNVQPGERIKIPITLRNTSNKSVVLDVFINDFINQKNTKEPLFTPNPDYSIKSWFRDATLSPNVTVPAQTTIVYETVLDVPYGSLPKTYYGGVFFISNSPGQETSVATQAFITVGSPKSSVLISEVSYETRQSFNKERSIVQFTLTNPHHGLFTTPKESAQIVILDDNKKVLAKQDISNEIRILPDSSQIFSIELASLIYDEARTAQIVITNPDGELTSKSVAIPVNQNPPSTTENSPVMSDSSKVLVMPALITGVTIFILLLSAIWYKFHLAKQNGTKPKKDNKP